MPRKTIEIQFLLEKANYFFEQSGYDHKDQRYGVASFLETILVQANRYKGFYFLEGHKAVESGNYDPTRRCYY